MIHPPDTTVEDALWAAGVRYIAGLDEAGRGALAGPVAVAAVVLPPHTTPAQLPLVRDSKTLTPHQREQAAAQVRRLALAWQVAYATPEEIDALGILPAVHLAAQRALAGLDLEVQYLLLDHFLLPEVDLPQTAMPHGEQRALSIAAASVLAKTARDALMSALDAHYPGYGFARHKGYGTPEHQEALLALGPSPVHRKRFAPVAQAPLRFPEAP